ncbi:MAG TPA: arabinan endo-1,5-alpha-L-arabinosidase [Acidimicrobiales bacterium]
MRHRVRLGLIAALVAVVLTSVTAGAAEPRGVSGDITPVHDPTMVRDGDTWYLFSTGDGMPIRRSGDLAHWEPVGLVFPDGLPDWVFDEVPGLNRGERNAWAPDISLVNGRWHLYWSIAVFGTRQAVTGLMTNATLDPTDPDYRWVDEGPVLTTVEGDPTAAIDSNAVTDAGTGRRWLVYGSFWDGIFIRQLDPVTGKLRPDAPAHNIARRQIWFQGIEGAYAVQHDGWWWLFASFGFCCQGVRSNYSIHVGRSRSITGPYVDAAGQSMLDNGGTTLTGSYGDVVGPGHGSVVQDGDRWLLVHHFYDRANNGVPTLSIRPVLWGPDGWPVAADPGFSPADAPEPGEVTGTWHLSGYPEECSARAPDDVTVTLQPDGRVLPAGSWQVVDDHLELSGVAFDGVQRNFWLLVDPATGTSFGRDDRTAAVRANRVDAGAVPGGTVGACGPPPTTPPGPRPAPGDPVPAPPVVAAPTFTG